MGSYLLISIVAFYFLPVTIGTIGNPIVSTPRGTLVGKYLISRNGNAYEAFVGIRYGVIPARFENAVPSPSWEGWRNASEFGPVCAQLHTVTRKVIGVEDCLYLNVYTPKVDQKKRPVLVFIHGGAFSAGSSDVAGGKYYVDEDVVLVTLNYRLGILGFLNTRDKHVTGNMGLKDQVLALKWIQENIESFGGDPSRVTISGESAGGASVIYHVLSPVSTGLFHSAVSQSGSALNPWAYNESTYENAVMAANSLQCSTSSNEELVSCLKQKSVEDIIKAQGIFAQWFLDPMTPFPPSLEVKSDKNPEPLVHDSPWKILKSGQFQKVPVLLTVNREEGSFLHAATVLRSENLLKDMNMDWNRVAPITFQFANIPEFESRPLEIARRLIQFYFEFDEITLQREANLTNLYTDSWFLYGVTQSALHMAKVTPVYAGLVSHPRKDFSILETVGITENLGITSHLDEIPFLFNSANQITYLQEMLAQNEVEAEEDVQFSKVLVKVIASFAETGIPRITLGDSPVWNPVTNSELESGNLNWLGLELQPQLHINPFNDRMELWKAFYENERLPYQCTEL